MKQDTALMLKNIDHIEANELREIIQSGKGALILHIFDVKEFELEHIPYSINLPARNIELLQELVHEKYRKIILYDRDDQPDNLSVAVSKLKEMGYTNLAIVKGGLEAWKQKGFKLHGREHITD